MTDAPVLIEGYASLFGVPDLSGDVVRAGAFTRALEASTPRPMLMQHIHGRVIGRWVRMVEDGRGLYVRGLIESGRAIAAVRGGLDGLSIGFRPRLWHPRRPAGRELIDIDLVEISLVAAPMQARARFIPLGAERKAA